MNDFAEMQFDRDLERSWREAAQLQVNELTHALLRISGKCQQRLIDGVGDREFNADIEAICHAVLSTRK